MLGVVKAISKEILKEMAHEINKEQNLNIDIDDFILSGMPLQKIYEELLAKKNKFPKITREDSQSLGRKLFQVEELPQCDHVKEIIRSRYCFSIGYPDNGNEVSKEAFDAYLLNFPKAKRKPYNDADVYAHKWKGEEKWIAMHFIKKDKYYIL